MAARRSSTRQARWQPYSFYGTTSALNKKALACLVRPQFDALPPSSLAESVSTSCVPLSRPISMPAGSVAPRSPAHGSQLPTPLTSPPGVPLPTLAQSKTSGYVLELALAILSSVYFQPAYRTPCDTAPAQHLAHEEAQTRRVCRLTPNTQLVPAFRPSVSSPHRVQDAITPLTPQSPPSRRIVPISSSPLPIPSLRPHPPPIEASCALPSRSDLARHLNLLNVIGSTSSTPPSTGTMRWFLTELFKRAAVPSMLVRVAAGYILRCRAAIAHALRSLSAKKLSPVGPSGNTQRERVLTDARRVVLGALVLACKFVFDKPYNNQTWSSISGLGCREIGECERVVGETLEWRLWIGAGRSPHAGRS